MFARPRDATPTRHLYVANCPQCHGSTQINLMSIAQAFGVDRRCVHHYDGKPFVIVSFDTSAEADRVRRELHGQLHPPITAAARDELACDADSHAAHVATAAAPSQPKPKSKPKRWVISFAEWHEPPNPLTQPGDGASPPSVTSIPDSDSVGAPGQPHSAVPISGVPGMLVVPGFVSVEEATELLAAVNAQPWSNLLGRRVQHYGFRFDYGTKDVDRNNPLGKLPSFLLPLVRRLADKRRSGVDLEALGGAPDQCTVNEYEAGQGIAPHVDTPGAFEGYICSVSLGSHTVMTMRRTCKCAQLCSKPCPISLPRPSSAPVSKQGPRSGTERREMYDDDKGCSETRAGTVHTLLPRRSLVVLASEARYSFSHGIAYRKTDVIDGAVARRGVRVSFTFRRVKREHDCLPQEAGTSKSGIDTSTERDHTTKTARAPTEVERTHVHQVYDAIAGHFAHTRHYVWPVVANFLGQLPPGALVIDAGCGNRKHFDLCARHGGFPLGCDRSLQLLKCDTGASATTTCGSRAIGDVLGCDVLALPYRNSISDVVLCVAVLQHLSTEEHRAHAVREIARVLRSRGRALIACWALEQDPSKSKVHFEQQDNMVPWHLRRMHTSYAPVRREDSAATKKRAGIEVYHRYVHVFRKGELENLCTVAGLHVDHASNERGNWCVICTKV